MVRFDDGDQFKNIRLLQKKKQKEALTPFNDRKKPCPLSLACANVIGLG
jgi:hypothetical protein